MSANRPSVDSGALCARRFPAPAKDAVWQPTIYALQDHASAVLEKKHELMGEFVPLSDCYHYRLNMQGAFGHRRAEFCGLADGFFITFADGEYRCPQPTYYCAPDALQIYIANSGDGEYAFARGEPLNLATPNAAIILEPAGEPAAEATLAGRVRYVHVTVHREVLKRLHVGAEQQLPAVLQTFIAGGLQRPVGCALPLGGALLRCLEDVHACTLTGHRRRLFLQSKALEILCHAIEALEQSDDSGAAVVTMLTARGVLKAQRVLAKNFVTPPSLEDLAHEVGLSRSALCTGFRLILGQSVFDHIQDLRMQRALELLNERGTPITQIAYAVGYKSAASFSVAVQRHFGATPTALRRRSISPAISQDGRQR